jgi:glycosyltransferase involved in cell wall biosynthesis
MSRWRIPPARVATVYHGVDAAATIERPVRGAARTLFTAGSIRPARGLEDVIRALALVGDDVQLIIAGAVDAGCEGYAEMLSRLCTELEVGSRVTFAGQLDETQMIEQFRGCSAFVLTSRAEACPNTALEAMSAGCPIVSVDRAPMPEFLADAALYYPIGDATVLAARLRELLADPVEQNRLSRAARSRVARFTWTSTRDRTIEELERVRA